MHEPRSNRKLQKHAKGLVRLASFRKTNGQKIDAIAGYTVEYTGEVEFLADCVWDAQELSATARRKTEYDRSELVDKHKGERAQIDNGVFFRKTENGWLPTE